MIALLKSSLFRALAVLVLLLVLVAVYFWTHNTSDTQIAYVRLIARVSELLVDTFTVVPLLTVAGAVGRRIFASLLRLEWAGISRLERFALETLIGLGLFSVFSAALGLIGLFNRAVLWLPLIVIAVVLRRDLAAWFSNLSGLIGAVKTDSLWDRAILLVLIVLLFTAMLAAFAPPYAWDSMTYHLVAAAQYHQAGQITAHPENFFLGFPQVGETLYGLTYSLFERPNSAAVLHFAFGALGLIATMGIIRAHLGKSAAWMAAVLLMSSFSVWRLLGWAYVDLAVMAFSAGALITVLRWQASRADAWLITAGVMIGFAVGTKYVAGGLAITLAIFVLIHALKTRNVPRVLVMLVLPALLVFAIWMVKGAALYGNPIYPYGIGGLNWDAARTASFNLTDQNLITTGRAWHLPILLLAATIFGVHGGEGYSFTSGVWLLTSPLLLIFVWGELRPRERAFARSVILLALPVLGFWMVTSMFSGIAAQTRLMTMAFPLAMMLGAAGFAGLSRFPRKPIYLEFVVRAVFAFTLVFHLADVLRTFVNDEVLPYSLGMISADDYLYQHLGAHYPALTGLANLPAGSQVRLMWEPRSFYCPPTIMCLPDVMFDHWRRGLDSTNPMEQLAAFQAAGDDYLLFFNTLHELDSTDEDNAVANALFLETLESLTPVWTDGLYYTLYRLQDE